MTTALPSTAGTAPVGDSPSRTIGIATAAALLVAHVLLGIGGAVTSLVPTAHAVGVVACSLGIFVFARRPSTIVAAAAYGGICDVFWRMTDARAPWELSKYLLAAGAVALMIRFIRRYPKGLLPTLMVLLLVPGMIITTMAEGIGFARDRISGYEMGLLSFAVAALAFRHLVASRTDATNLGWVLLGPLVAALAATSYFLVTSPDLEFGAESNFNSTGGYGPNQVSSAMGLITLICILLAFLPRSRRFWPLLGGLSVWALWATFLTFSRGGIYSVVIAGGAMLLVGISSRGARVRSVVILVFAALALLVVFSSANDFSGNFLNDRYQDSATAGRSSIAELDIGVFGQHPLTGVGSGRAPEFRSGGGLAEAGAHTEFTRVLAEHGMFGLAALGLIVAMLVQAYRCSLGYWNRLMIVALSIWSLTTMLHAATRIGAVAVMLALTQLRVEDDSARVDELV